jgi:HSP20 family protein
MTELERYEADHPLTHIQREISRAFQRFWEDPVFRQPTGFMPTMNLREETDRYVVEAELPGIDPKDVEIEVHGNTLTIRGERKQQEQKKGERMHRLESRYGLFQRTLTLPQNSDPDRVHAEYRHGILHVFIPKDRSNAPRRIEIKRDVH